MLSILPSLIAGDILNLEKQIKALEPYASGFHLDIMDFAFVPNLSWGPEFVNAIRKVSQKKLELHMMVEYPEKYFDRFELNTCDIISFHIESKSDFSPEQLINKIKEKGWQPSIALRPSTPIEVLFPIQSEISRVLIVSVEPGFSGQEFLPYMAQKIKALIQFRESHNLDFNIEVDGGLSDSIIKELVNLGVNEFVSGCSIFSKDNPAQALKILSEIK